MVTSRVAAAKPLGPLQLHEPPDTGCGPNLTEFPTLAVAVAVTTVPELYIPPAGLRPMLPVPVVEVESVYCVTGPVLLRVTAVIDKGGNVAVKALFEIGRA